MKSLSFILPFCFTTISSIEFNFNSLNLDEYISTPYRILRIPPWSTDYAIKKKYKTLVKKLHSKKNSFSNVKDEFPLLQKAYEELKKTRKLESSNDNSNLKGFYSFLYETFIIIFRTRCLFNLIHLICWLIYKVNQFIFKPMIFGIITFHLIETVFPHIFQTQIDVIIVTAILTILLYFLTKSLICKRCFAPSSISALPNLNSISAYLPSPMCNTASASKSYLS